MPSNQRSIDPFDEEKPISDSLQLYRFTEPLILITLSSIAFYIFSYGYYQGFFDRLSIPFKGLDLPFTFYLSIGFSATTVFITIIILAYIARIAWTDINPDDYSRFTKRFKRLYIISLPVIFFIYFMKGLVFPYMASNLKSSIVLLLLDKGIDIYLYLLTWMILILITIHIISYIQFRFKNRKSLTETITAFAILLAPFIVLSVLLLVIYTLGFQSAGDLIEGRPGCLSITFQTKDNNTIMPKEPLILVMYHNERYYVVEKNSPAPFRATLHIIPDSDMINVTIQTIPFSNCAYNLQNVRSLFSNLSI